ncbi:MAG: zinc ribbon domain-containing protein, partial [Coriobacteriales bacterium]|nr:zinc ribbon domain-containing protein [Coriobacteriales bacterium]
MYCKNCGKRVNEGERFCASCGAPLAGDPADETAHLDPDETVIAYPESTAPASTDETDIIYHAAPGSAARLDDTLIT